MTTRLIELTVDLLDVDDASLLVRDRATGVEHRLGFDGIAIGSNFNGDGYRLIVPAAVALAMGISHAA